MSVKTSAVIILELRKMYLYLIPAWNINYITNFFVCLRISMSIWIYSMRYTKEIFISFTDQSNYFEHCQFTFYECNQQVVYKTCLLDLRHEGKNETTYKHCKRLRIFNSSGVKVNASYCHHCPSWTCVNGPSSSSTISVVLSSFRLSEDDIHCHKIKS